jgi:hypothetical protein
MSKKVEWGEYYSVQIVEWGGDFKVRFVEYPPLSMQDKVDKVRVVKMWSRYKVKVSA